MYIIDIFNFLDILGFKLICGTYISAEVSDSIPVLSISILLGPPGRTQAFPNLRPGLLNCFGVAPEE